MIEIQELYKYYGDRRAIGPLSAEVAKGEIVGLLGLNGAGKTTTLRVLACDLMPTSGTVKVGGFDVVASPDEVRARVGYLPDRPPLYDDMTVNEYLSFAARLRRVASNELARRTSEVIDLTGLGKVRDQLIGTLSHGFRQRVGIAQAIVHRPEFVVLDEPISGLDPVQIVEMRELVRSLRGAHTVIVSSHILSEISETCDRLFFVQDGVIRWAGTEAELFTSFDRGTRFSLSVRNTTLADLKQLIQKLPGIEAIEEADAREPGEGVLSVNVAASVDVRDQLCKALVGANVGILELVREHGLEGMVLKLLGGEGVANRALAASEAEEDKDSSGAESKEDA